MATNFWKIKKGLNFDTGNSGSVVSAEGDVAYNSTSHKVEYKDNSATRSAVSENGTQTLTNKTLSGNTATSLVNGSGTVNINSSGTVTLPNATDTLVGKATTDTLTNKTISGSSNTLSGIAASSLVGSDITTVGTITSGTWTGTTIAIANGGTGQTSKTAGFDALSPMSASGDVIYGGASGTGTRLAKGSDGQILTLVSGLPSWSTSTAITNPMTTVGDIIYGGASGVPTRLAAGTAGQVLRSAGTAAPGWNFPYTTVAKSASYTVLDTDGFQVFLITTGSSADVAITLPAAANNTNRKLTFKKVDAGTKKITITRAGSDTIDGYTTTNIGDGAGNQYSWISMVSDGTNWSVTGVGGETLNGTSSTVPTVSAAIVTSVTLPAGTWQVYGNMSSNDTGSATALRLGISTGASTTYGTTADLFIRVAVAANGTGGGIVGPTLAQVTSSTVYNIVANSTAASFATVTNMIQAYRIR